MTGYAMSKHAALAFTHGVRLAGWEHGIRATAVCPGWVDTEMSRGARGIEREAMTAPATVAELVTTALRLPDNASVSELTVNCVPEQGY